jgi:Protein of unknown function (DUF2794)
MRIVVSAPGHFSALALKVERSHHWFATSAIEVWRLSNDRSEPEVQILRLPWRNGESAPPGNFVGFDRRELQAIFNLYGRMVASGVWRDYALDFLPTRAIFSIFRRNGEFAYYRIVKEPKAGRRQGAYSIVMQSGLVMKRGAELPGLLAAIEKTPKLVS